MLACVRSAITCHSLHWQAWRGSHLQCTLVIKHKTFKDFCFDQQGGGLPKTFKKLKFLEFFLLITYSCCVDANLCFATPILCTPFSAGCGGGGGWASYQIFEKGGGTGQDLNFERGLLGKKGWLFSRGVAVFSQKINWNLKYLLTKSFINKNVFLYIRTKNLNWEILPKNSVTWDEMGF